MLIDELDKYDGILLFVRKLLLFNLRMYILLVSYQSMPLEIAKKFAKLAIYSDSFFEFAMHSYSFKRFAV